MRIIIEHKNREKSKAKMLYRSIVNWLNRNKLQATMSMGEEKK